MTGSADNLVTGETGMLICWPGPLAMAAVIGVGPEHAPDEAHLVLRMDPLDLMLTPSPQPHGLMTMARFLRELAQSATEMADRIDPDKLAPVLDYSSNSEVAP